MGSPQSILRVLFKIYIRKKKKISCIRNVLEILLCSLNEVSFVLFTFVKNIRVSRSVYHSLRRGRRPVVCEIIINTNL